MVEDRVGMGRRGRGNSIICTLFFLVQKGELRETYTGVASDLLGVLACSFLACHVVKGLLF